MLVKNPVRILKYSKKGNNNENKYIAKINTSTFLNTTKIIDIF